MSLYIQYQNATNLRNFLFGTAEYKGLKQLLTLSIDDFFHDYFDIDTCNEEGLKNWGRLLDLNNGLNVPYYKGSIGFGDSLGLGSGGFNGNYPQNFNNGNFFGGGTKPYTFAVEEYRLLLRLKYRILTSNFSYRDVVDILNVFVKSVDPAYKFRLIDSGVKNVIYSFNFIFPIATQQVFYEVLNSGYLLPVPMGISYTVVWSDTF